MAAIDLRQVDATCSRHMVTDSNEVKDFLETNWARLSPTFRRAHNQLREARGLPPLAEPAVDLWVPPPPSEVRKLDPAGPEFNVAAREFLGSSVPAGNSEGACGCTDSASDEEFFAWLAIHAHDCTAAEMAKVLADVKRRYRRFRLLRAETWHAWIRAVVRSHKVKWHGILAARDHLGAPARSSWRVIADAPDVPAAPKLDRERTLRIFADNIRVAEESNSHRAAEFLRRQLRRFERSQAD